MIRKIVLIFILAIAANLMVGFGTCGVIGLVFGDQSFSIIGIGTAITLFFICRSIIRAIAPPPNKVESSSEKIIDPSDDR
ncbi:hypothetical protein CSQ89_11575 [Chitinimonas sp. BJB300]|nr:hypothetical protein CSQ89_11575 [Chitinimonas sp. BJB300]